MTFQPRLRALLTATAAAAAFAPSLFAQDECLDAAVVPTDAPTAFDTTTATPSTLPWTSTGNLPNDVWFTFTPTVDYTADISTCDMATYDTRLEVYSGACGALVSEGDNDDGAGCGGFTSEISGLPVLSGVQYWVRVGGFGNTSTGTGTLLVTGPPIPPFECVDAVAIATDTPTVFDTTMATVSAPDFSCSAGGDLTSQDVWFTFTAAADYMAQASTCNTAAYDTKIEVYEGSCGALVTVACNDDGTGCAGFTSLAEFMAVTGTQYWVRVGGWQIDDFGTGELLVTGPPPAIMNDECVGAIDLTSGGMELFDTALATNSASAPAWSCGGASASALDLWYTFTPLLDGSVTIDTEGSGFDTRLEVYEGSCGVLVSIDCDDDGGTGALSLISFPGVGGTTYFVRVAGFGGDFGMGQVNASFTDSLPNDDCAGAIPVMAGISMGSNVGATDSGVVMDCSPTGGNNDVWFSYTATSDLPVTIDLSGSSYDTVLEIFDGSDCMALVSLACDDDGGTGLDSLASFDGVTGTTYLFHIGGFNTGAGDILINIIEGNGIVLCAGEINSTGVGSVMQISGSLVIADQTNPFLISVTDLPLNATGFVIHSADDIFVANPGGSTGNLCIASLDIGRFDANVLNSGMTGEVSLAPDLAAFPSVAGPFAVMVGDTRNFQFWHRDTTVAGPATSNFSSAISVTFE